MGKGVHKYRAVSNVAPGYGNGRTLLRCGINGVVVTWVVAIDPPGVRFPLNALMERLLFFLPSLLTDLVQILGSPHPPSSLFFSFSLLFSLFYDDGWIHDG